MADKKQEKIQKNMDELQKKWSDNQEGPVPQEAIDAINDSRPATTAYHKGVEAKTGQKTGFFRAVKQGYKDSRNSESDKSDEPDIESEPSIQSETVSKPIDESNNEKTSPISEIEEAKIRERARVDHDEKEKIKKEDDEEASKGCMYFILIGFAVSGIGYLINWIF